MSNTHTPGPWETSHTAGHETHGQSAVYEAASGRDIAIVYDGKANARLIAAAPELAEVVRLTAKLTCHGFASDEGVCETCEAIREARALLAEIDGQGVAVNE